MRIAVFVINLDRDKDRLAFMARQLDALGLAWERFPAVLGIAVPDELRAWFFTPEGAPSPALTPGEIGVYASHLSAHRRLLASDFDAALVFEDDVEETLAQRVLSEEHRIYPEAVRGIVEGRIRLDGDHVRRSVRAAD